MIIAGSGPALCARAVAGETDGAAPTRAGDPFVRVRGDQLVLDGAPFRFAGANLALMHHPENRAAAEALMTQAARDGIRVARIWALGEGAADAAEWQRDSYFFRAGPTGWIEAATDHLDRVIVAARRAGVRLVITLANNWPDYGGVPQYLRWSKRWRGDVYGAGDRFYADAAARAAYRAHVERLVGRTNAVTGIRYRDDPTILAWELMNESQVVTTAGATTRRIWITEMAALIHRLDPNHLVTPGVSLYRLARERREWLAVCRLPGVDYCDSHVYPEESLAGRDPDAIDATLDDFVQLARYVAGKPLVLGEFGFRGGSDGLWQGHTRAWWIARVFARLRLDGAAGGLLWIYQPGIGTGGIVAPSHAVVVGDPRAQEIRLAMRAAALAAATPARDDQRNPLLGAEKGDAELAPLHAVLAGPATVIPLVTVARSGATRARIAWDPPAFERASWETTGVYRGGALIHAWGAETGFFEFGYDVAGAGAAGDAGATRARGLTKGDSAVVRALALRARVSSEYPGTLSPPDGASQLQVWLDDVRVGAAIAPRDDGQGRWVTIRSTDARAIQQAARPGHHRLRFAVVEGRQAHGLCLYGRAGDKPVAGVTGGAIELTLTAAAATTKQ